MVQRCRALLVVVLLLLASAGTASAECAWVLWFESLINGQTTHVVRSAWSTHAQCESERLAGIGSYQGLSATEQRLQPIPGTGGAVRYVCLPDTIDPRGPKGK
jgi:hypothetical protein